MFRIQGQYLPAKLAILITTFVLCGCSPLAQRAQSRGVVQRSAWQPDLLIVRDGWGIDPDQHETVRNVLESAGSEIWQHFPDQKLKPIVVYPKGGPIVLYQRGPEGEIVIKLNTGQNYHSQYAYQFSHEICHVLSRYDQDPHGHDWFEESVCETASLFSLRAMSRSWQTNPPYRHWKGYSQHLAAYAQERIDQAKLPKGKTLRQWYVDNAYTLNATSVNRELNTIVAVQLLPMFESNPENWGAVAYLNNATPDSRQTLAHFLYDWHNEVPQKHKKFVSDVAGKFGIRLSPERSKTLVRVR